MVLVGFAAELFGLVGAKAGRGAGAARGGAPRALLALSRGQAGRFWEPENYGNMGGGKSAGCSRTFSRFPEFGQVFPVTFRSTDKSRRVERTAVAAHVAGGDQRGSRCGAPRPLQVLRATVSPSNAVCARTSSPPVVSRAGIAVECPRSRRSARELAQESGRKCIFTV